MQTALAQRQTGVDVVANIAISKQEAEEFLFREALLLDERMYEEWLELFTPDGIYWLPMDEAANPDLEPSIIYDDEQERRLRVHQILHQPHYAQMPPSRTVHSVSNLIVGDEVDGNVLVFCNLALFEIRQGNPRQLGLGDQRTFAARCEYKLRRVEPEGTIAMSLKKVVLINRDTAISNLSFIV